MSTLAFQVADSSTEMDDFAALEQRVLRAVELLKSERAARTAAEARVSELLRELDEKSALLEDRAADLGRAESEVESFKTERNVVRTRIERLLGQLDDIAL